MVRLVVTFYSANMIAWGYSAGTQQLDISYACPRLPSANVQLSRTFQQVVLLSYHEGTYINSKT